MDKFSRVVSREEIRGKEYNLNIPRYVDSSEEAESWDIWSTMFGGIPEQELAGLREYWAAFFLSLKESLFWPLNEAYYELKVENLKDAVPLHPDIVDFTARYTKVLPIFSRFFEGWIAG